MTNPYWPLFDLELRTPRLTLRLPTDEDLVVLASLLDDVHDPEAMPFSVPWTIGKSPERERSLIQHHWKLRSELSPQAWGLEFAVVFENRVVGLQRLVANDFSVIRSVKTGPSWVARSMQGRGIGTEMRVAALALAFDHMDAYLAHTNAFDWNGASIAVTTKLGYQYNGEELFNKLGKLHRKVHYRLTRETWLNHTSKICDVTVSGLDKCADLLGCADPQL